MIFAGKQIWEVCADCNQWVRLNKPLFGSLHICLTEDEIKEKNRQKNERPDTTKEPSE